jgi:hypothetical protein
VSGSGRPRRPAGLAIGDRIRVAGTLHTVIAVLGTDVRLAGTDGVVTDMALVELQTAEDVEVVTGSSRRAVPSSTPLDGLPEAVAAEALWWERHIVEVLRGVPPHAPAGTRPKPEYDPATVSLTRREQAKAAELVTAGRPVTASAIAKRRRRYEARGVVGMVDHRVDKPVSPHGRADPAVVEAMRKAIDEATQSSSRTASYLFWRTEQILEATHGRGVVELPSQRSLYRLLDKLSAGKHTTGSARTRRSLADHRGECGRGASLPEMAPGVGLPGKGAFGVEVASSGAIRAHLRHVHDNFGAQLDSLDAGVPVQVGLGEARLHRVDPHVRKRLGVLHGDHVDRGLGRRVGVRRSA